MQDRGHFLGVSGDSEEVDPPRDSRSLSDSKGEPANSSSDSATKMNVKVTFYSTIHSNLKSTKQHGKNIKQDNVNKQQLVNQEAEQLNSQLFTIKAVVEGLAPAEFHHQWGAPVSDQWVLQVTDDVRRFLALYPVQGRALHGAEACTPGDGACDPGPLVGDPTYCGVDRDQLSHQFDILAPHLHLQDNNNSEDELCLAYAINKEQFKSFNKSPDTQLKLIRKK